MALRSFLADGFSFLCLSLAMAAFFADFRRCSSPFRLRLSLLKDMSDRIFLGSALGSLSC